MRSYRMGVLVGVLFLTIPVWAQQASSVQTTSAATKDPQAISVVNQALTAAGGPSAITRVSDYTATGNVTYHLPQDVQGTITIRALGVGQFRMDANLPAGERSEVDTDSSSFKDEHGLIQTYPVPMSPSRIGLPVLALIPALTSPGLNLSYKGIVQLAGRPAYQIEVQRFLPISLSDPQGYFRNFHTVEYFIDATTFQVAMTQDIVTIQSVRQISYSNYQSVSGVLVPFSISEQIDGQAAWQITIAQIAFNSGLQNSDFQL